MGVIKSTYDAIKEFQFRGPIDESKRHQFGIGISKYQCIICGERRKDVDKDGVCPDCNKQFPIKNNIPATENPPIESTKEEINMNTNQRIKKQLSDLSVSLNEKLSEIISEITIAVNNKDIEKIQRAALEGNFIKESQNTIDKFLDEFEDRYESESIPTQIETNAITIDISNPPSLSFTKIMDSKVENENPRNWSNLIRTSLRIAFKRGYDINRIRQLCSINIKQGFYSDEGYKYEPTIDLSYQELDANKSFENVIKILQHLGIGFSIKIYWRQREGSQYPGKYGIINWKP